MCFEHKDGTFWPERLLEQEYYTQARQWLDSAEQDPCDRDLMRAFIRNWEATGDLDELEAWLKAKADGENRPGGVLSDRWTDLYYEYLARWKKLSRYVDGLAKQIRGNPARREPILRYLAARRHLDGVKPSLDWLGKIAEPAHALECLTIVLWCPLAVAGACSDSRRPTAGNGLNAEYFSSRDLTGLAFERVDPQINFDWGRGSPGSPVGADRFSVRWTGFVVPRYSEVTSFHTVTDDGVRLWVDDELVIDKWVNQSATEHTGSIYLEAGRQYAIKMEYYENAYDAVARLLWSSSTQAKEVIPSSRLTTLSVPQLEVDLSVAEGTSPTEETNGLPERIELFAWLYEVPWNESRASAERGNSRGRAVHESMSLP